MKTIVLLYVPFPNAEEARSMAKTLLDAKLISCANVLPAQSTYFWEGALCEEGEFVLLAKTVEDLERLTRDKVETMHSYALPCLISWKVAVNDAYFKWMTDSLRT